jgi:tight adherence protein C
VRGPISCRTRYPFVTPILIAFAIGIGIFLVFFGLARTPPETDTGTLVEERLQDYEGKRPLTIEEVELAVPFTQRFLRPAVTRLGTAISRSSPGKARENLARQLDLAGQPGNLTPEDFAAVRIVAAVVMAVVGLGVGFLLGGPVFIVVSLAVGAILGFYLPVLWLRQRVDSRRAEIQKGLPDAMDLLVIAVDAGLGFDAALVRVTEKYRNALSVEFAKMLREVSLGRPRGEAMDEMGRSSGVDDLHNFIQAVIQSEQFGTGIGKILRIQADEMRRKRRQRAQEKAAQATLKMLLPMVGCIFPTLWIVLLGPAILIIMVHK